MIETHRGRTSTPAPDPRSDFAAPAEQVEHSAADLMRRPERRLGGTHGSRCRAARRSHSPSRSPRGGCGRRPTATVKIDRRPVAALP